jgi:hypothetical protein
MFLGFSWMEGRTKKASGYHLGYVNNVKPFDQRDTFTINPYKSHHISLVNPGKRLNWRYLPYIRPI